MALQPAGKAVALNKMRESPPNGVFIPGGRGRRETLHAPAAVSAEIPTVERREMLYAAVHRPYVSAAGASLAERRQRKHTVCKCKRYKYE
jgi:hypothetical protein